jgi:shikimate 5-dehydrogenase
MLLHQGAQAYTRWFQEEPDTAVMWNALMSATGRS